jgi:hypothetical protein
VRWVFLPGVWRFGPHCQFGFLSSHRCQAEPGAARWYGTRDSPQRYVGQPVSRRVYYPVGFLGDLGPAPVWIRSIAWYLNPEVTRILEPASPSFRGVFAAGCPCRGPAISDHVVVQIQEPCCPIILAMPKGHIHVEKMCLVTSLGSSICLCPTISSHPHLMTGS